MIQNKLFRDCFAAIPAEQKAEFDLSFSIAERISEILKAKGLTQKDFARLLNKRDSEISKWLTGRHNFTTQTIARIETALGSKLISIAHLLDYALFLLIIPRHTKQLITTRSQANDFIILNNLLCSNIEIS